MKGQFNVVNPKPKQCWKWPLNAREATFHLMDVHVSMPQFCSSDPSPPAHKTGEIYFNLLRSTLKKKFRVHFKNLQLMTYVWNGGFQAKGHFTHKTESPWPVLFKHFHWWKRRSRFKFAWGTDGVCECKLDVKSAWTPTCIKWIMFHGHLDYFHKSLLGGGPHTKLGDHGTPNAHRVTVIDLF